MIVASRTYVSRVEQFQPGLQLGGDATAYPKRSLCRPCKGVQLGSFSPANGSEKGTAMCSVTSPPPPLLLTALQIVAPDSAEQTAVQVEPPQDAQTRCEVAAEGTPTVLPLGNTDATPRPVLSYTKEEQQLAGLARKMAMNQNVLYHGTRYAQSILRTSVLFAADPDDPRISLTRSPEVAAYFASMPRDDCEGRGAILIFDRERLRRHYKIYPLEEREVGFRGRHNEAEEELWGNLTDVGTYLIGFVSAPTTTCSYKIKKGIRTQDAE